MSTVIVTASAGLAANQVSSVTFPNGTGRFDSTALTSDEFAAIFQPLVAEILGIDPATDPTTAYSAVRIGWQQEGQPSWAITDDVCTLRGTPLDDPYSRVRDEVLDPNDSVSLTKRMKYTQVWSFHACLYGPNGQDHARMIVSAMSFDWVREVLAASKLYAHAEWPRPVYAPENYQGRWWKRTDVDLKFNELVNESLTVPSAAGVDVTVIKETGLQTGFSIRVP